MKAYLFIFLTAFWISGCKSVAIDEHLVGTWKGQEKIPDTGVDMTKIAVEFTRDGEYLFFIASTSPILNEYYVDNGYLYWRDKDSEQDYRKAEYQVKGDTLFMDFDGVRNIFKKQE